MARMVLMNDLAILDLRVRNIISPDELTYYANRAVVMTYKEMS